MLFNTSVELTNQIKKKESLNDQFEEHKEELLSKYDDESAFHSALMESYDEDVKVCILYIILLFNNICSQLLVLLDNSV